MIYTSYFARIKYLPDNIIPIAICAKSPHWFTGIQYKQLAPKYGFFMKWKETHDNAYYIEHFYKEVLNKLSVPSVLKELQSLLPEDVQNRISSNICDSQDFHIALICYEKPDDFCHRHLVADWLNENGIKCREFGM